MSLQSPMGLGGRDLIPLGVALAVIGVAEGAARYELRHAGDDWAYWSATAAEKVDEAQAFLAARPAGAVLFVGDSTAARHFSPAAFESRFGQTDLAYNLGFPGNFPLAFDAAMTGAILPEVGLEAGDRLIISFHPKGFENLERVAKSEAGILDSVVGHEGRGQVAVARYLHLAALRPEGRIERSRKREPPPAPDLRGWQTGVKVQPPSDWAPEDPPPELVGARFEAFERLLVFAKDRKLRAAMVIPPHPEGRAERSEPAVTRLKTLCAKYHVPVFDYRRTPGFADRFADPTHLRYGGAEKLSRYVAASLLRREETGTSAPE